MAAACRGFHAPSARREPADRRPEPYRQPHARAILNLPNGVELAQQIVAKGLSEHALTAKLGLTIEIAFDGKGGALTIHDQTLEQLDEQIAKLR